MQCWRIFDFETDYSLFMSRNYFFVNIFHGKSFTIFLSSLLFKYFQIE
jgi:hypothetical protein